MRCQPLVLILVLLWVGCQGSPNPPHNTDPLDPTPLPTPTPVQAGGEAERLSQGSLQLIPGFPQADSWGDCQPALCQSLRDLIHQAEGSLDFAFYGIRGQPQILTALTQAQARGIPIRGVVDSDAQGRNIYADTPKLQALIPGIASDQEDERFRLNQDPDARQRIMHHKFLIKDGCTVWTGSANVSDTDIGGYSANLGAVIQSCEVGSWYQQELEQMRAGSFNQSKISLRDPEIAVNLAADVRLRVYFSPQDDPFQAVVREIQGSQTHIDVAMFYLTHPEIARALIAAHQRGVKVRVITDATAAANPYSQHQRLRQAGIPVKVENWGGKMHMKAAAIDQRVLILGSMNWTRAGFRLNDENTLIAESAVLSQELHGFFQQLWDTIPERWLTTDPRPESPDSPGSCRDGLDNDHDGRIDARDPDCS